MPADAAADVPVLRGVGPEGSLPARQPRACVGQYGGDHTGARRSRRAPLRVQHFRRLSLQRPGSVRTVVGRPGAAPKTMVFYRGTVVRREVTANAINGFACVPMMVDQDLQGETSNDATVQDDGMNH